MPNVFAIEFKTNLEVEFLICKTLYVDFPNLGYRFSENRHTFFNQKHTNYQYITLYLMLF
jgi:hypothetical protein